jgi:hypothetical protein
MCENRAQMNFVLKHRNLRDNLELLHSFGACAMSRCPPLFQQITLGIWIETVVNSTVSNQSHLELKKVLGTNTRKLGKLTLDYCIIYKNVVSPIDFPSFVPNSLFFWTYLQILIGNNLTTTSFFPSLWFAFCWSVQNLKWQYMFYSLRAFA